MFKEDGVYFARWTDLVKKCALGKIKVERTEDINMFLQDLKVLKPSEIQCIKLPKGADPISDEMMKELNIEKVKYFEDG